MMQTEEYLTLYDRFNKEFFHYATIEQIEDKLLEELSEMANEIVFD